MPLNWVLADRQGMFVWRAHSHLTGLHIAPRRKAKLHGKDHGRGITALYQNAMLAMPQPLRSRSATESSWHLASMQNRARHRCRQPCRPAWPGTASRQRKALRIRFDTGSDPTSYEVIGRDEKYVFSENPSNSGRHRFSMKLAIL